MKVKKTVSPRSIHLLAIAAARWVFPDPLGPENPIQPSGAAAKALAASTASAKSFRLSWSESRPWGLVASKSDAAQRTKVTVALKEPATAVYDDTFLAMAGEDFAEVRVA